MKTGENNSVVSISSVPRFPHLTKPRWQPIELSDRTQQPTQQNRRLPLLTTGHKSVHAGWHFNTCDILQLCLVDQGTPPSLVSIISCLYISFLGNKRSVKNNRNLSRKEKRRDAVNKRKKRGEKKRKRKERKLKRKKLTRRKQPKG